MMIVSILGGLRLDRPEGPTTRVEREAAMAQNQKYQGKNVRNVRDAKQGDAGFQEGQDQVVVTMDDGTEKVVKRNEVTQQ